MAVLIAGPTASGKPRSPRTARPFCRLISTGNCCTSNGMSEQDAVLAANAAYYHAFATGDFAAMSQVWADDNVSCIHPGWPALIGRQAVLESYRRIFNSPNQDRIEPRNETVMIDGSAARVLCVEFVGGTALATTNLFQRVGSAWRMTHHQASPIAALVEEPAAQPPSNRLN
jgi:ketosteroid isomerase-like protein